MKKWIFLLALIPIASFLSIWLVAIGDSIPHEKASFMTMVQALSPVKAAIEKCWVEHKVDVTNCSKAKELMSKLTSSGMTYFMTVKGTLIGINYENRVIVVFSPKIKEDSLTWHCAGDPQEAIVKLCDGSALVNLEPANITPSDRQNH